MSNSEILFLIPPVITLFLSVGLSILSISKSKKKINILFSIICLCLPMTSASLISQQFLSTETSIIGLERISHFFFCYIPFLFTLFFHNLTGVKRRKTEIVTLIISFSFSILTFSDLYISGLRKYNWGYVSKSGPLFYLFIISSLIIMSYLITYISIILKKEKNYITKLKLRYALFSFVLAGFLSLMDALPVYGINLYPMSNFIFIPLAFLAYGLLRYRVLRIKSILYMTMQHTAEMLVVTLPNIPILYLLKPLLIDFEPLLLIPILVLWFYLNTFFYYKIQPTLNIVFKNQRYKFKKAERKFIEDILMLKNISLLIKEFNKIITESLQFTRVDFFISGNGNCNFENTNGFNIQIHPEAEKWFISKSHLIEKNMVGTNPYYSSTRDILLEIFEAYSCECIIPMVQNNQLIGIVFLSGKKHSAQITRAEVQFINNIKEFVVIALYNSILFHNISELKEVLEDKTDKLSDEIVERKRAEKVLIESEARYKLLADNIIDTIWVVDLSSQEITYVSPSVEKLLNYTPKEIIGCKIHKFIDSEDYDKSIEKVYKTLQMDRKIRDKSLIQEMELIKSDRSRIWVEFSVYFLNNDDDVPINLIGVARDISERKEAEKEKEALESKLRQSQKMESIGILAGGIAHDFNNILMAILGYTQLALMNIPKNDQTVKDKILQIEKASNRAKDLVTQILAFSRQSKQEKVSLDLILIVFEAINFLSSSLPSNIEFITEFQEDLKPALADPIQMHQIIINLCTNAHHAMGHAGGKCIISLHNNFIDDERARHLEVKKGSYLKLSITDTGKGIEPEIIGRIFEPYFTTKEISKGTGMGLAVVHGIIKSHNGAVTIETEPGKGATFTIFIPASKKKIKKIPKKHSNISTGNEKVLFVDDEETIVSFVQEALDKYGYKITATTCTDEALSYFKRNPDSFDIVITDLTMPEITGDVFAEKIHKIRDDIPIILCTGYSDPITEREKMTSGISEILLKPLSLEDLTLAMRNILDNKK